MVARATLLPSKAMNAPEFADKLDQEAEPAVVDAMGYRRSAPDGGDRAEHEADKAHRRTALVAFVAAVSVVALAGILYFSSGPSRSDLDASSDETAGFSPELALPQAPGLSSASRAFSPSSVLGALPAPDAGVNTATTIPAIEPLSEIGSRLAPEWKLALAIQANPDAYADTVQGRDATVSRAASQQANSQPAQVQMPSESLAHVPALPADAQPAAADPGPVSVGASSAPGLVSTEIVHPGITRRTYTSQATLLAQQVAECKQKGFLAGEACRLKVCEGNWGKVPACPRDEPAILP